MCARHSVSVSVTNRTPSAVSWARSASAFSMMPLCTTATRCCASVCGWALVSLGSPWVAQRVWPMPTVALVCFASSLSLRSWTRPADLVICSLPRYTTARPAESYPRYSSRCNPSTSTGVASRLPMYPTIPHIGRPSSLSAVLAAVDHAAELALRVLVRLEPARPELAHDQRPDVVVLTIPALEVFVALDDVLLDRLAEVRHDICHDPRRGRFVQPGAPRNVADQVLRVRIIHRCPLSCQAMSSSGNFLPEFGQKSRQSAANRASIGTLAAPGNAWAGRRDEWAGEHATTGPLNRSTRTAK